jgi:hypothetical protein
MWCRGHHDIEVLRAEIDASGYDLVLECNGVLRYVQFKSSHRDATTRDASNGNPPSRARMLVCPLSPQLRKY